MICIRVYALWIMLACHQISNVLDHHHYLNRIAKR